MSLIILLLLDELFNLCLFPGTLVLDELFDLIKLIIRRQYLLEELILIDSDD